MSDIQIAVNCKDSIADREKLLETVEKDIKSFDDWFMKTYEGNEPLAHFERSIIKTYLMFKLEHQS